MSDSVYKIIEIVGTSPESWDKAAANAVTSAASSLRDLRIAEVTAFGRTRRSAVNRARANIRRIHCMGAFHRTDIGETLWPPGVDN